MINCTVVNNTSHEIHVSNESRVRGGRDICFHQVTINGRSAQAFFSDSISLTFSSIGNDFLLIEEYDGLEWCFAAMDLKTGNHVRSLLGIMGANKAEVLETAQKIEELRTKFIGNVHHTYSNPPLALIKDGDAYSFFDGSSVSSVEVSKAAIYRGVGTPVRITFKAGDDTHEVDVLGEYSNRPHTNLPYWKTNDHRGIFVNEVLGSVISQ